MPNIKPISDLKIYSETLKQVSSKSTDLDNLHATEKLLSSIQEGEKSAKETGWLSADEMEAALGL